MSNDDDLRRKALDVFRQSFSSDTGDAAAPERPQEERAGAETDQPQAAAETGAGAAAARAVRRKTAMGAAGRRRKGAAMKPHRTQSVPPVEASATPASSTARTGRVPGRSTAAPARGGNGLLWLLLVLQVVLLIACIVLAAGVMRLSREVGILRTGMLQQGKMLQTIGRDAAEARLHSQVKFGVYRSAKGELRGVVLNYKKPERMKDVPLK